MDLLSKTLYAFSVLMGHNGTLPRPRLFMERWSMRWQLSMQTTSGRLAAVVHSPAHSRCTGMAHNGNTSQVPMCRIGTTLYGESVHVRQMMSGPLGVRKEWMGAI